jgi:hypothetical protein
LSLAQEEESLRDYYYDDHYYRGRLTIRPDSL